jgi:hypothetical protein
MHKLLGLVLLLSSLAAVGMAFLAHMSSTPAAEKYVRQTPESYALADAANAARLARTCSEIGIAPPQGSDPDSIQRWHARAQHAVVRRMIIPHTYGWPAASLIMLTCGIASLTSGSARGVNSQSIVAPATRPT